MDWTSLLSWRVSVPPNWTWVFVETRLGAKTGREILDAVWSLTLGFFRDCHVLSFQTTASDPHHPPAVAMTSSSRFVLHRLGVFCYRSLSPRLGCGVRPCPGVQGHRAQLRPRSCSRSLSTVHPPHDTGTYHLSSDQPDPSPQSSYM